MRLALVQIDPTVGDLEANAGAIAQWCDKARQAGAELVAFPELCLCGYPPKDLLLQGGFVEACSRAAKRVGESASAGITLVFGVPLPSDGRIANSLVVYRDNTLLDYYDKRLLPTYDVFDEDRYFTPGHRPVVIDVGGVGVGLSICEDLWKGEDAGFSTHYRASPDPVAELVRAGAMVILSPSASPFVLGKGRRHRNILRMHATRHGVHVAAVNQVGGNDELIFDGHAAVYDPAGRLVGAAPGFVEDMLVVDIPGAGHTDEVPDPLLEADDDELLFRALVLGVRDYCRKTGFKSALIGISGGIDSAVTAAIAAAALRPANVTGIAMPGKYSSSHSVEDAADLARRLGIGHVVAPIGAPFDGFRSLLDEAFGGQGLRLLGEKLPDLAEENLQSRLRGTLLMAFSNRTGAILLTTGNKSELAVGYCTLYGDMNGGLAVLNDVTKRLVYRLARWMNSNWRRCGFGEEPIPARTIEKPPSAELAPNQKDEDSLPPYDVLDQIIERYVEGRQAPGTIAREAGIDPATVARVVRMIHVAEYKRKQLATGLKVTTVAFGFGRRWPIAQGWRDDRPV